MRENTRKKSPETNGLAAFDHYAALQPDILSFQSKQIEPKARVRNQMKKTAILRFLYISLAFFGCFLANENGLLYFSNHQLANLRMQLAPRPATGQIVLVEIDNKSLTAIGHWPWKRSIYADIIRKSFAEGASEIAFDIDFSSHSSPKEDAAFETALIEANGPVTLAIFQQRSSSNTETSSWQSNRPIEQLETNAWAATVNVLADSDGMVRHLPYAQLVDGEAISSVASMLGGRMMVVPKSFVVDYGIKADSIPVYSIIDLLSGRLPADALKNKKVLVGAGAAELRDNLAVPVMASSVDPNCKSSQPKQSRSDVTWLLLKMAGSILPHCRYC